MAKKDCDILPSMPEAFDVAWNLTKQDADDYCDEVFDAMESHDLSLFEAVMAVSRLVGVRGKDLHRACMKRMEREMSTQEMQYER